MPIDSQSASPLAIVGMGCLFPKADGPGAYWANIRGKVDCITEVPGTHWRPEDYFDADPKAPDMTYARRGGFLSPVDFNPLEFGIAPRDIEATDTTQLLGLVVAKEALKDAGYWPDLKVNPKRVSVILGVTGALELVVSLGARLGHPKWKKALLDAGIDEETARDIVERIGGSYVGWQENSFPGLLGNVVAGRIANRLNLGGTNCAVDAACASSLGAIHLAAMELEARRSDLVITGGMDTFNDIFMYMCFSKTPALSPTGDARPFDVSADGTILGEGLGVIALRRLEDARRDQDRVYAVIKGLGSSSDGGGNAVYAPSSEGQASAVLDAYEHAGVTPDTIELVEAHGTGTIVGDKTELSGLINVYRAAERKGRWCALGTVKSQIGHTKAAAGAAGLIKAALALHHKVLPPTIKVEKPVELANAEASSFYINTEPRPWLPSEDHPRRAAVSAFGFGGSNFHCVLEEDTPRKAAPDWDGKVLILPLCADRMEELVEATEAFPPDLSWNRLRVKSAEARAAFSSDKSFRLILVIEKDASDLSEVLSSAAKLLRSQPEKGAWSSPNGIYFGRGEQTGKLGILFPGQGAQYPGMLRDLACTFPEFLDTLGLANRQFPQEQGQRLSDFIYPVPVFEEEAREKQERALGDTRVAQPALGAVSLGALRVLERFGVQADAAAGHSYGELVALCAASRMNPEELFEVSRLRGELMAAGEGDRGSMVAVNDSAENVQKILGEESIDLVLANWNAPDQVVLSGATAEIEKAVSTLKDRGLRCKQLAVSAAFHSPHVAAASEPFLEGLRPLALEEGRLPVFANTTGEAYPDGRKEAAELLAGQLASPVQFVQLVNNMYRDGVRTFLEVGPGARLGGLVKSILSDRAHTCLSLDASSGKRSGLSELAKALARLAAEGHPVSLAPWDEGCEAVLPAEREKPALTVPLTGANYFVPKEPKPPRPRLAGATPATGTSAEAQGVGQPAPEKEISDSSNSQSSSTQVPDMPSTTVQKKEPAAFVPQSIPEADPGALDRALHASQSHIAALQQLQEQTAQLHKQFLEGQELAQQNLHTLIQQQQRLIEASLGLAPSGPAIPLPPAPVTQTPTAHPVSDVPSAPPVTETAPAPPPPAPTRPVSPPPEENIHSRLFVQSDRMSSRFGSDRPVIDDVERIEAASGTLEEYEQGLLDIVADKTGYPADMLNVGMEMDADLGVDSIKRVEILSAFQDRFPEIPEIKSEHLGDFQTLKDVLDYLCEFTTAPVVSEEEPSGPSADELSEALLEIVAEKTGYPADMLELGMELDADLGIDSIKRVEILSALEDRVPGLPEVKSEHLGEFNSLQQVVDFLSASGTPAAEAPNAVKDAEPGPPARPRPTPTSAEPETSPPAPAALLRCEVRCVPLEQSASREPLSLPEGALVWITDEDAELARALKARLNELGLHPEIVSASDARLGPIPENLHGLALLAPPGEPAPDFVKGAFFLMQAAGKALRSNAENAETCLLSLSRLGGKFGLEGLPAGAAPVTGALAGLVKTAALEWPEVHCKALDLPVDLPDASAAAGEVAEEMLLAGPVEVGLPGQQHFTTQLREQEAPEGRGGPVFEPGELIVISGGARGITAEVALALAREFRPALAILGRSPEPQPEPDWLLSLENETEIKQELATRSNGSGRPREIAAQCRRALANREILRNLERLQEAGATVLYRSVDVRDSGAVQTVLRELENDHGPVRGIIHGAGVLADRRIDDKTGEQFDAVFTTKVEGLKSLLGALDPRQLRALVLFSSSTARFGRIGQVDYSAANEVLNKFAQQQSAEHPGCRALSINWGPWDGGMVTPQLRDLFESEGVRLIPLQAGATYLTDELGRAPGQPVEIVIVGKGSNIPLAGEEARPALPASLSAAFEKEISPESVPVLKSHVMDGRAVLPMALTMEWLAHGAIHENPGLAFHGLEHLQVLKGIRLEAEDPLPAIVCSGKAVRRGDLFFAPAELVSRKPDGEKILHARAEVILADRLPAPPPAAEELPLGPYSLSLDEIYKNHLLFHGPDLQGIQEIDGCSAEGIAGTVAAAPRPAEWIQAPLRSSWLADPLALDCAFQLMILWSFEIHGCGSLPCAAGQYRQFARAFPEAGVRIVARIRESNPRRATADIEFLDSEGRLIARINDYECVLDPGLRGAFARNRLEFAPLPPS